MTKPTLEAIGPDTVDASLALMHGQGWAFEASDVQRLIDVSNGGFFGAFDGDRVLGVALALPLGDVGWIGNVLVHPDGRGRGLGTELVQRGLAHLDGQGCRTHKLYATPRATPLYERLGFTGESEVLMMRGESREAHVRGATLHPDDAGWDGILDLDRRATGADRGPLLHRLATDFPDLCAAVVTAAGEPCAYGFARSTDADPLTGDPASEIGPVVGLHGAPGAIDTVIDTLLSRLPEGPIEVAVPRSGPGADPFRCRGFDVEFVGLEMRRGPVEGRDLTMIAAAAGQEKG